MTIKDRRTMTVDYETTLRKQHAYEGHFASMAREVDALRKLARVQHEACVRALRIVAMHPTACDGATGAEVADELEAAIALGEGREVGR